MPTKKQLKTALRVFTVITILLMAAAAVYQLIIAFTISLMTAGFALVVYYFVRGSSRGSENKIPGA